MKLSILVKILTLVLMGFYVNKKTFDPIEYFSKKPQVEICRREDESETIVKEEKNDKS